MKKRCLIIISSVMISMAIVGCVNTDRKNDSVNETSEVDMIVSSEETEVMSDTEDGLVVDEESTSLVEETTNEVQTEQVAESVGESVEDTEVETLWEEPVKHEPNVTYDEQLGVYGEEVSSEPGGIVCKINPSAMLSKDEYSDFGRTYPRLNLEGEDIWTGEYISADLIDRVFIEVGKVLLEDFPTDDPDFGFTVERASTFADESALTFLFNADTGEKLFMQVGWSDTKCDLLLYTLKEDYSSDKVYSVNTIIFE